MGSVCSHLYPSRTVPDLHCVGMEASSHIHNHVKVAIYRHQVAEFVIVMVDPGSLIITSILTVFMWTVAVSHVSPFFHSQLSNCSDKNFCKFTLCTLYVGGRKIKI